MRRNAWFRLLLVAAVVTSLAPLPARADTGCRVATVGLDRPEWFCQFYAAGPIEYTVASASGWAIDRLIEQHNDGTIVYERLAGMPASDNEVPPLDIAQGTVDAQEGWLIRIQILASVVHRPELPPPANVLVYRNGVLDAAS